MRPRLDWAGAALFRLAPRTGVDHSDLVRRVRRPVPEHDIDVCRNRTLGEAGDAWVAGARNRSVLDTASRDSPEAVANSPLVTRSTPAS
jgi:hypothetical protein